MFGFNVNKLKPNLKMAVHRIGIVKNKKANAGASVRREIATLLADGKEEKARIRVEGIIRDDFTVEGYEILELLCELVAERANLLKTERECPFDMREAVCTLIWAANRTEIAELTEVKKQLVKKYGQDFAAAATRNVGGCVNERVIQKLSVQPPSAFLVVNYMKEIAKQFHVTWEPDESVVVDPLAPMSAPTGASVLAGSASGPDYVALYAAGPQAGNHLAAALPSAPVEKPTDADAFRVRPPSVSSRMFAPPPPPPNDVSRDASSLPPPPPYHEYQNQHQMPPAYDESRQHHQQHNHPQQQQQQQASYVEPQQQQHQQQQASYVAPHATPAVTSGPALPLPPTAAASAQSSSSIPDFDELTARFERLRKRQGSGDNTSFTF